ncbi:hypothetical protein PV327_003573 [Microctonus hyperodae]|uniref:TOG domain-containing protein n=1 Tax=Microctonus hyperodae TaxID=165561 RepID=A0AA39G572_MICHY|nr:hypothetical protein PV327_003573 [Microctonus hyperodae]
MSECIELQQMTGSTRARPLKPREEELLSNEPIKCTKEEEEEEEEKVKYHQRQRMTPVPQQVEQPMIQLTPLWEHVVRTQQFPPDVDTSSTFIEIISRLRDPEWEVRQHALRVLVDVLPTLDGDCLDELMTPVLIQLINNLGHLAPAVRKGALDALRIYVQCSGARDDIIRNIMNEGLNREDVEDSFQTNITLGVILSTPSLLFPSPNCPKPSEQSLKTVITALTECLSQVTNQEAAVRSLVKIRDVIGIEEFNSYFTKCDPSVKRDFDVLCQVYKLNQSPKYPRKIKKINRKKFMNEVTVENSENTSSCDNELKINGEKLNETMTIPPSRIVLETEIKLNEETAIMMTILEEKDVDSDADSVEDNPLNRKNLLENEEESELKLSEIHDETKDAWIERRKTPRRVHFGGEIIKLRTPDSDDSEVTHVEVPQTRIPLPIAPVTKMVLNRSTRSRSRSNPSSPNSPKSKVARRSRSVSNSPKRDFYIHDGNLSPKKSILIKNNSYLGNKSISRSLESNMDNLFGIKESDRSWSFEVFDDIDENILEKEKNLFIEKPKKQKKVKKLSKINSANKIKKVKPMEQMENLNKPENFPEKSYEINFVEVPEIKINAENTPTNSPMNVTNNSKENNDDAVSVTVNEKNLQNLVINPNEEKYIKEYYNEEDIKTCLNAENVGGKKTKDKIRCSPRKLVFETFPRQERNYILMELSSPVKGNSRSREVSPQGIQSSENSLEFKIPTVSVPLSSELNTPAISNEALNLETSSLMDVNTTQQMINDEINKDIKIKSKNSNVKNVDVKNFENSDDNGSKTDDSANGETKIHEPSWEELGLVDQNVLNDLHNKVSNKLLF